MKPVYLMLYCSITRFDQSSNTITSVFCSLLARSTLRSARPYSGPLSRAIVLSTGSSAGVEQLAAEMPRPMAAGTFKEHLAACLEGGAPFAWDRRRLGIEQSLEEEVCMLPGGGAVV